MRLHYSSVARGLNAVLCDILEISTQQQCLKPERQGNDVNKTLAVRAGAIPATVTAGILSCVFA